MDTLRWRPSWLRSGKSAWGDKGARQALRGRAKCDPLKAAFAWMRAEPLPHLPLSGCLVLPLRDMGDSRVSKQSLAENAKDLAAGNMD